MRSFMMRKIILSVLAACVFMNFTAACNDSDDSDDNELKMQAGAAYYLNVMFGISAYDSDPSQTPNITKSGDTYTFSSFDVIGDGSVTVSGTVVVTISVGGSVWDANLSVSGGNPLGMENITCHDVNEGESGTFAVDDDEREITYLYDMF